MGFLDIYDTYVNNKCDEIDEENGAFENLTSAVGLSSLVDGVKGFLDKGIVASLADSPLRNLGEDVLSQLINDNARNISQNLMNVAERFDKKNRITSTLTDARSLVFNAVTTALTFQNDMVLFFAAQVAEKTIDAIRDKRETLIELRIRVQELHNALLVLAGGGPFFREYLASLRQALVKVNDAEFQLALVQSAFSSRTVFLSKNYNIAKTYLDEAYDLIMPPVTGTKAEELNQGFLNGVLEGPKFGDQLSMLMTIPRLTMDMLKAYDLYVVKVIKVNALLLGFQNVVQNLKEVTGGSFKDIILDQLTKSRVYLADIIKNMSLQLNGEEYALTPVQVLAGTSGQRFGRVSKSTQFKTYEPNPTVTSAKAVAWGVQIKAARLMLEAIDASALQNIAISNEALAAYQEALEELSKKDDRVASTAILRATDGREQPGDIEADFITFAFQANQAILDSSLLENQTGSFDDRTVLALGAKLSARINLSIDQDKEIEGILLGFIDKTKHLLSGIQELGNSLFRVMDDLGMDRAKDALQGGLIGDFFSMSGQTSTYVGAAVTGLSFVQSLLSEESQRTCLNQAVSRLKSAETSKKLAANRTVRNNYSLQQTRNAEICEKLRKDSNKVDGCSSTLDPSSLRDNPTRSLSGLFRGVFGGDMAQTLGGSSVATKSAKVSKAVSDDANADAEASAASGDSEGVTGALGQRASELSKNAKATPNMFGG
jgi:hypothetical protein